MSPSEDEVTPRETVPPPGPGGPADRVEPDPDDLPLVTPDQPRSAQVEEEEVPDEIEEPEESDEEAEDAPPDEEPPG